MGDQSRDPILLDDGSLFVRPDRRSAALAVISLVLVTMVAIICAKFGAIFADLGMARPMLTRWAISARSHGYVAVVLVGLCANSRSAFGAAVFLAATGAYLVVVGYALYLPMTTIVANGLGTAS